MDRKRRRAGDSAGRSVVETALAWFCDGALQSGADEADVKEGALEIRAALKKAKDIGKAWKALAQARGATMQDFDDQHPNCAAAAAALRKLGVRP